MLYYNNLDLFLKIWKREIIIKKIKIILNFNSISIIFLKIYYFFYVEFLFVKRFFVYFCFIVLFLLF